ncbi:MAG: nucleoside-diphosphate kinase [Bacteroidetes bacterium HGW-Bacteroidetes-22]|nr:MAG: nucleoside-diphosphate kinase [Bacteroidetes bacterium HGW-Bacteroidetes-22]
MAISRTFTIVKPTAYKNGNLGKILTIIEEHGFSLKALKILRLSVNQAEKFYDIHKDRPFFRDLVDYMSSGTVAVAILEKDNAVEAYRELIGSTDPSKARTGTIRNLFGTSIQANAVHGSDSDENAIIEGNFFFKESEIV